MREVLGHQEGEECGEVQTFDEATEKKTRVEERRTMIEGTKVVLEAKRVKIAASAEDAKMLTLNVDSLDAGARMIGQSVCYQML